MLHCNFHTLQERCFQEPAPVDSVLALDQDFVLVTMLIAHSSAP